MIIYMSVATVKIQGEGFNRNSMHHLDKKNQQLLSLSQLKCIANQSIILSMPHPHFIIQLLQDFRFKFLKVQALTGEPAKPRTSYN